MSTSTSLTDEGRLPPIQTILDDRGPLPTVTIVGTAQGLRRLIELVATVIESGEHLHVDPWSGDMTEDSQVALILELGPTSNG